LPLIPEILLYFKAAHVVASSSSSRICLCQSHFGVSGASNDVLQMSFVLKIININLPFSSSRDKQWPFERSSRPENDLHILKKTNRVPWFRISLYISVFLCEFQPIVVIIKAILCMHEYHVMMRSVF
jgi:hypothetical protein